MVVFIFVKKFRSITAKASVWLSGFQSNSIFVESSCLLFFFRVFSSPHHPTLIDFLKMKYLTAEFKCDLC